MEFEDSRKALFVEPNAYVQRYEKQEQKHPKKIVFREPYECMSNHYMNNGFKKFENKDVSEEKNSQENKPNLGLNFNGLTPILSSFLGGSNLGGLLSSVGGKGGFDISKIVSTLMQDKSALGSILNLFTGKKINKKKTNEHIKQTDYEIKNYTRVE